MKINFTNEDFKAINKIIDVALRGGGITILPEVTTIGSKINKCVMEQIAVEQTKKVKEEKINLKK